MPSLSWGSPWRMSVELVQVPGARLARQTLLDGEFLGEGRGPGRHGDADDVALFDLQRGAELDRLAEVGAEDLDRALAAQVVAGRVGAGDAPQDRQARLRRGAEEAVEEGALLVGRLGQGQGPGLDRAGVGDQEGRAGLAVADLEAGDAADRLAGQPRAGGVRDGRGLAEHHGGAWGRLAALVPAARAVRIAREPSARASASRRPLRGAPAANAPCEDLDIPAAPLVESTAYAGQISRPERQKEGAGRPRGSRLRRGRD